MARTFSFCFNNSIIQFRMIDGSAINVNVNLNVKPQPLFSSATLLLAVTFTTFDRHYYQTVSISVRRLRREALFAKQPIVKHTCARSHYEDRERERERERERGGGHDFSRVLGHVSRSRARAMRFAIFTRWSWNGDAHARQSYRTFRKTMA